MTQRNPAHGRLPAVAARQAERRRHVSRVVAEDEARADGSQQLDRALLRGRERVMVLGRAGHPARHHDRPLAVHDRVREHLRGCAKSRKQSRRISFCFRRLKPRGAVDAALRERCRLDGEVSGYLDGRGERRAGAVLRLLAASADLLLRHACMPGARVSTQCSTPTPACSGMALHSNVFRATVMVGCAQGTQSCHDECEPSTHPCR